MMTKQNKKMMRQGLVGLQLLGLVAGLAACDDSWSPSGERSKGLGEREATGGPRVVWDAEARPLPEIPLPNDVATRLDPTSPTGRRLNVSEEAPTEYERDVRRRFNRLDGFGTFAPASVSFDAPLDLAELDRRHNGNDDFRDDAVFLLNVDRDCARFGEEVAIDMSRGRFPVELFDRSKRIPDAEAPEGYQLDEGGNLVFSFDDKGDYNTLLFEERNEDANGNGQLDPGEDRDGDGRLAVANFIDPEACAGLAPATVDYDQCVVDNLLTHYDRASNSLLLRPVWPLEELCTYAVVLSNRLTGADGKPVESPFEAINPRDQTEALAPLSELLPRYGLALGDVAFAWSFTTGTQTKDLQALRAGLYGHGPFAFLSEEFPVTGIRYDALPTEPAAQAPVTGESLADYSDNRPKGSSSVLDGACAGIGTTFLWKYGQSEYEPNLCALEADFSAMSGIFSGTFKAPYLLADQDGLATPKYPHDADENWKLDYQTGELHYGETDVTFWCSLPAERDTSCSPGNPEGLPFCRPFPVVFYTHGYGSSRGEISSHMGRTNAMGYAMCGVDGPGHGLNRWLQPETDLGAFSQVFDLFLRPPRATPLFEMIARGRDRDLNNDILTDPGADMWTADLFHTRDMVRQHVLEDMQFVRMLRAFNGENRASDGTILGDLDNDGRVDIGGPQNTISMWGISLGGIVAGVLAGAEPSIDAAAPNAGGGGLTDISIRSRQGGVPEAVLLPMLGPYVAGCLPIDLHQRPLPAGESSNSDCMNTGFPGPYTGGTAQLAFFLNNTARLLKLPLGRIEGLAPGDTIELRNLDNREVRRTQVNERGWFRLSTPADALDALEKRTALGFTDETAGPLPVTDNTALGDRLELVVYEGTTNTVRARFSTFGFEASFEGATFAAGSPLVAVQEGLAYRRNTPEFRRFVSFAQTAIGPADPGVWAAHYSIDPIDVSYDTVNPKPRQRVLAMPTGGDWQVPVATGLVMARSGGILGSWKRDPSLPAEYGWRQLFVPDPRYGVSVDQMLIDRHVVESNARMGRYEDNAISAELIYDVDNVSDGRARYSCDPDQDWAAGAGEQGCPDGLTSFEPPMRSPQPEPGKELRQTVGRADGDGTVRYDALRIPIMRAAGQHGIYNAQPFRVFDTDAYMVNYTTRFLGSRGRLADDLSADAEGNTCDCSASALPRFKLNGTNNNPAFNRDCEPTDLNLGSPACAAHWDIRTPEENNCATR